MNTATSKLKVISLRVAMVTLLAAQAGWAALVNTANTTYRDSLSNNYSGTSNTVNVTVITAPSIGLVKSANPASVAAGAQVTFTIVYTNSGGAATNVAITDTIPVGSTLVAGSITQPAGVTSSVSGGVITWTVGNVAAGATGTVTFKVTAN
jgi:large repetitive protein